MIVTPPRRTPTQSLYGNSREISEDVIDIILIKVYSFHYDIGEGRRVKGSSPIQMLKAFIHIC